jgi:hypothetical protein
MARRAQRAEREQGKAALSKRAPWRDDLRVVRFSQTKPAPIKPNNATPRAGNHGADGASPSKDILHIPKFPKKNACLRMGHSKPCGLSIGKYFNLNL